jgi:hypothetical protein
MTHLPAITFEAPTRERADTAPLRVEATLRAIAALAAAFLIAATGFVVAQSLGQIATPPAIDCSETCPPTSTGLLTPTSAVEAKPPSRRNAKGESDDSNR